MNWRAIRALISKDLMIVRQSRAVMIPIIIVPVLLVLVLPAGLSLLFSSESLMGDISQDMALFVENMPERVLNEVQVFETQTQQMLYLFMVYQFAPLFLIVPMMMANVLAADSFAGEKERKTLEALLYTPATDLELYTGKLLMAWLPALAVTLLSGLLYAIVVNVFAYPLMGQIFFPPLMWVILIIWVAPATAGLGLAVMVMVSSRVSSFQEAYQLGGVIVIPVVVLLLSQLSGLLYLSTELLIVGGLFVWLLDAVLLWYGARSFERSELIARL